jgi:hypothetical protein
MQKGRMTEMSYSVRKILDEAEKLEIDQILIMVHPVGKPYRIVYLDAETPDDELRLMLAGALAMRQGIFLVRVKPDMGVEAGPHSIDAWEIFPDGEVVPVPDDGLADCGGMVH